MIVGPLSGKWSDTYGPKMLTVVGLALTTAGLAGLAFIDGSTPLWMVCVLMVIFGTGGGLFISPNASSVMGAVPPEHRGTASGARVMLRNTGSMFSLAVAFPLVLTGLSPEDIYHIFLGEGVELVDEAAMALLVHGLGLAFLLFAVISIVSVVAAMLGPRNRPA
jgi:MFS family permease